MRIVLTLGALVACLASASAPSPPLSREDIPREEVMQCAPRAERGKWTYSEHADKMRGTTTPVAVLLSDNTVDLGAPYGRAHLGLSVERETDGDSVGVGIVPGQLSCEATSFGPERCPITFRLDDDAPRPDVAFKMGERNDIAILGIRNSSNGRQWIGRFHCGKRLIVEVPLFQSGRQQFEFTLGGFEWPPRKQAEAPEDAAPGGGDEKE